MTNEEFTALYHDALRHGWAPNRNSPLYEKQKRVEKEYNARYYSQNKEKWKKYNAKQISDRHEKLKTAADSGADKVQGPTKPTDDVSKAAMRLLQQQNQKEAEKRAKHVAMVKSVTDIPKNIKKNASDFIDSVKTTMKQYSDAIKQSADTVKKAKNYVKDIIREAMNS